jgi:polyisoprenoid-binding protein YceI
MNRNRQTKITMLMVMAVSLTLISVPVNSARLNNPGSINSARDRGLKMPSVRRYHIDAGQSTFMVHAFVGGLLSAFGHNHNIAIKDISGETEYTDGTLTPASLHMRVVANSLTVTDKVSESDRQSIEKTMREQVLETGKYADVIFNSTKVEATRNSDTQFQAKIWGDLTLHGVTHNIPINAQLTFDNKSVRARGEFSLKMSDYSIKPPSVGGGTVTVKDTLKFNFNILSQ